MPAHRAQRRRRGRTAASLALALVVLATGCRQPDTDAAGAFTAPSATSSTAVDYLPGVAADVHAAPSGVTRAPVVVLVPGGGWQTADRSGLEPLASRLAEDGAFVVNATYRVTDSGARFPTPVADMLCAVGFAVARAKSASVQPTRVVLVGHSAAAHLGSLAALAPDHFRGECPWPPARIDGFVGLAGPYNVLPYAEYASELLGGGPAEQPSTWREADPFVWAASLPADRRPSLLLVHGDADPLVPVQQSRSAAARLRAEGYDVSLVVLPGADHATVYTPQVVAGTLEQWLSASSTSTTAGATAA